jgi:hypothetical protein
VKSWYDEVANYSFTNPAYPNAVGHFAQVVWRGSPQVGCGVATCGNEKLWVRRYSPPGNWNVDQPGVLADNVWQSCPPGQTPTTTTTPPPAGSGSTTTTQTGQGWSAFAVSNTGWGFAAGPPDEQTARRLALQNGGGEANGCAVFWTTTGRCVAYAESRNSDGAYWYAAASNQTEQQAQQDAAASCQSGGAPAGTCKSVASNCQ